jgi:hypothetical protein
MKDTCILRKIDAPEIQLTQEDKLISMMNSHEMRILQFEPVSIQIRMRMTKVICTTRKIQSQEIQLRQEEKWISMMNNDKMPLTQFESVSIQIRM